MIFSSHIFIFYFLPLVLCLYYLLPFKARTAMIALSSYVFYGWANPIWAVIMFFGSSVDYVCGLLLVRLSGVKNDGPLPPIIGPEVPRTRAMKVVLAVSIVTNLGLLAVFKYTGFVAENVNAMARLFGFAGALPVLHLALPVGISFYTFKMAKKILIANPMGHIADAAFAAGPLRPHDAWFGVTGYAFQIYFDFSGYSDMAIGLALMMGFVLIQNFDSPYKSESITDFWRRWHISLSTWLRDYLYVPLGGNRKGPLRTYMNLMTVMLLGGLWHGASWNFVIWGGIHGGMLAFERAQGKNSPYRRLPGPVRVG